MEEKKDGDEEGRGEEGSNEPLSPNPGFAAAHSVASSSRAEYARR